VLAIPEDPDGIDEGQHPQSLEGWLKQQDPTVAGAPFSVQAETSPAASNSPTIAARAIQEVRAIRRGRAMTKSLTAEIPSADGSTSSLDFRLLRILVKP
jgi:hypothetical protein